MPHTPCCTFGYSRIHALRQETIKLYVIFNVLEIFDKYCAWLGQDILDALFSRKRQTRVFLVAVAYTRRLMCSY